MHFPEENVGTGGGGGGKMFLFLAMSCLFLVLWMSFQPASPDSGPGTPVLRGVFIADGLMSRRGLEKQQDKKDNNEPGNSEAEEGAHTSCGHEHEWGVFFRTDFSKTGREEVKCQIENEKPAPLRLHRKFMIFYLSGQRSWLMKI